MRSPKLPHEMAPKLIRYICVIPSSYPTQEMILIVWKVQ